MLLPTVKIKHERRGYVIINESDYDPKKHTLYVEEAEKAPAKKAPAKKAPAKKEESEDEAAE